MSERRGSWPWRKKTISKVDKTVLPHVHPLCPASSFKCEVVSSSIQNGRQEVEAPTLVEEPRLAEAIFLREEAEAKVKALTEQLSNALEDAASNEAMAKRHEKVMEEAVSGWEKAEKESLSYKQELDVATKQKLILEDRVAHLDGALKECMKQVRHVKEEQEKKIEDTILAKTKEWEKVKGEIDARQMDLERRLMESEAQNTAMTKSMQERARKILESNDAREKVETQGKVLQVKIVSLEKEISALKYELHVLNKELEIRNEEVECNKKAADAAHKQHLENVKKVAKLEADCQRLKNLLRKKLPGPAAIAQMKREVDGVPFREVAGDPKRRQSKSPANGSASFLLSYGSDIPSNTRDVELLKDRMSSMEEETKLLREALSKRNEELTDSRVVCAKTANKLSKAEDQIESLQGTPKESMNDASDSNAATDARVGILSKKEATLSGNAEEASCAESWASALISELALIRKGDPVPETSKDCINPCMAVEASASNDEGVSNQAENAASEPCVEDSIVYARSQELYSSCKELDCKFSAIQEQMKLMNFEDLAGSQEAMKGLLCSFDIAREKFARLKCIVAQIEEARQICGFLQPSSPATMASSEDLPLLNSVPISCLRTVLSKLVCILEVLLPRCKLSAEMTSPLDSDSPSEPKDCVPEEEGTTTGWYPQKESLIASKESFLEGKTAVSEFLIRYGIILCEACDLEHPELEELLGSVSVSSNPQSTDISFSGFVSELAIVRDQHQQALNAKAELEVHMATITKELGGANLELGASKELVINLQHEVAGLQALEQKLKETEARRVELQQKLENAEGERIKLQATVETLSLEIVGEKKAREEAMAKCLELEHQLEGRLMYEDEGNGLKVPEDDDTRLSKERELVAAKEKLAECQRTILALGKQLSALSSPPTELSPGGSFDTGSVDSMLEQRMHMELQTGAGSMEHHPNNHPNYHHSHHGADGRYNGESTSPRASIGVAAQYNVNHSSSRRVTLATPPPQQQQQPMRGGWSSTGGGRGRPRAYTEEMQLDPSRNWTGVSNGSLTTKGARHRNGSPLPVTEHPHHQTYLQPPVLQRRSAYVSPSCQYSHGQFDGGVPAWAPVYLPEEDEHQLALSGYSPPHTALSSPARSPGRFVHQLRSGQAQASGRTAIRTSLTESMNAAASSAGDSNLSNSNFSEVKGPAKASAIGKLFSRSRNNR